VKVESSQLQQVYARFPSLKVNADKGALEAAATKVLGAPAAKALIAKLLDKNTYLAARTEALSVTLQAEAGAALQQPRKAVVSGLSSGGLLSAIVLAKAGYKVDAFEAREGYSRQMQFSSRQALIDELASIDPALSQKFLEVSGPLTRGFVFTLNEKRKELAREAPHEGDPTAVPTSGEEMLSGVPISLVECRVLEQVLFDYLKAQPNVTVHSKTKLQLGAPDAAGRYSVEGVGVPDLVVVSEGANSATRKQLGIESMATSPTERIIAGTVGKGSGGRAALKLTDSKRADGSTERILSMALGSAKVDKTWVLVEVKESFNADPGGGLDPTSDEFRKAQQALVEKEFRAEAALVMETDVSDAPLEGAIAGGTSRPTLFTMQQRMSNRATAGSNVVGLGDFVGNAHFTVGGGMATAAVSHVERLKALVFDLEMGVDRGAALSKYEQGALEDSMAWGKRGIAEFYPDVDSKVVSEAYVTAVRDWLAGKNKDPLAALEKLLEKASEALPAIGKAA
jgi:2-polyprenyl-6-methoxyphenol hydroxylase-like FAD-dependent oxidoreductase